MASGTSIQFLTSSDDFSAITTSDTVSFSKATKGIYVGGNGNMVCINADGTAITFTGVVAGTLLPIRTLRVNATNTTATNMVAIF